MFYQWRWYYHVPNLLLWAAALASLVLLYRRRGPLNNVLAIPAVLMFVLLQLEGFSGLLLSLIAVWIILAVVRKRRLALEDEPIEAEVVS